MTAVLAGACAPAPALPPRRTESPRPARHGWATHGLVMVDNGAGDLVPEVPGQLYAGIAGWRSRSTWLAAFRQHPRLAEAVRRYETCAPTLYRVIKLAASYAEPATGRGIAVAHATLARQLEISAKVVQRCLWAAEDLGLLIRILDGSDMTLAMRMQVRDHYPRGSRRGTRSKLPNVYAATLPRWLAVQLPGMRPKPARGTHYATASVDNSRPSGPYKMGFVYPPVGGTQSPAPHLLLYPRTTTFGVACGKTPAQKPTADTTAATRPTTAHQKTRSSRHPRRLDPAVEAFARAFRRNLPGFRDASLHRICPALSYYVTAGLSVSDLQRGLDDFLAATGRTWHTHWRPEQTAEQAKYLIGMISRTRRAGYLPIPSDDDPDNPWRG